ERAGLQRCVRDRLQAGHRGQQRPAHGDVFQDADVHFEYDHAVSPATFTSPTGWGLLGVGDVNRGSSQMSMVGRRAFAGVVVVAAVAGGAVIARADDAKPRAAAAAGGLKVNPALIDKAAAAGE